MLAEYRGGTGCHGGGDKVMGVPVTALRGGEDHTGSRFAAVADHTLKLNIVRGAALREMYSVFYMALLQRQNKFA